MTECNADLKDKVFEGGKNDGIWVVELEEERGELVDSSSFDDDGGVAGQLCEHFKHFKDSKLV